MLPSTGLAKFMMAGTMLLMVNMIPLIVLLAVVVRLVCVTVMMMVIITMILVMRIHSCTDASDGEDQTIFR